MLHVQFLSQKKMLGYGTTEMRCVQPVQYLNSGGWKASAGPIQHSIPLAKDVFVFHRVGMDKATKIYLDYAKYCGIPSVYDTDDLVFEANSVSAEEERSVFENNLSAKMSRSLVMRRCDVVLVSTAYLAEKAKEFHPDVRIVTNGLSRTFVSNAERYLDDSESNGPVSEMVTFGYMSGSSHHDDDFSLVQGALLGLLAERPQARVLLMGKLKFSKEFYQYGERFIYKPFVPYESYGSVFEDIDINLVPLRCELPFNHARSEIKYIEAGAYGIPTVASPTATYSKVIEHGVNGMLALDSDWPAVLLDLAEKGYLVRRLGFSARKHVMENYYPDVMERQWDSLIEGVIEQYGSNPAPPGLQRLVRSASIYLFIGLQKIRTVMGTSK